MISDVIRGLKTIKAGVDDLLNTYELHPQLNEVISIEEVIPMSLDEWTGELCRKLEGLSEMHEDVGKRVELVSTTDEYTTVKPGHKGFIFSVDAIMTRHILWDGGSALGLVPGEDKWKEIEED